MKARATRLVLAAAALVALLLAPGGTAAAATKPKSRLTPPSIDQEIGEQGSNGFQVTVSIHDRHGLTLTAGKTGNGLSVESAVYEVPYRGAPGSDEIKVDFGRLGRIDMRFEPEKVKESKPKAGCTGGKIVEEEGFWVGLLAFHGEHGFTDVRVRSALGTVNRVPALRCRPQKPFNLKKLERELEAIEKEHEKQGKEKGSDEGAKEEVAEPEAEPPSFDLIAHHGRVGFFASRSTFVEGKKKSSESDLVAAAVRHRGRITETGSVVDLLGPGPWVRPTDAFDPAAETTVKPTAPFSGSAVYRTPPKGKPTWSGDLKVDLPGFGEVGLAGPGSRAVICEGLTLNCGQGLIGHASLLQRLLRR